MKYCIYKFIFRLVSKYKFNRTKLKLEKRLKFWQHELGYFYNLDLYTLKIISQLFSDVEPRTRFNYALPDNESSDWSE